MVTLAGDDGGMLLAVRQRHRGCTNISSEAPAPPPFNERLLGRATPLHNLTDNVTGAASIMFSAKSSLPASAPFNCWLHPTPLSPHPDV